MRANKGEGEPGNEPSYKIQEAGLVYPWMAAEARIGPMMTPSYSNIIIVHFILNLHILFDMYIANLYVAAYN